MSDALSEEARAVAAMFVQSFTALAELEKTDAASAFAIAEAFGRHLKSKWPMAIKENP